VIGGFLIVSGGAEAAHARLRAASARLRAATMMSASVVTIPDRLSVQQAADSFFLPYHYTAFPVIDAGDVLLGLVTISLAEAVPAAERATTCIGDIADRDPTLVVAEDVDVADLVDRPAFARNGRAVVVDHEGSPIGMVSITDVQHSIRALRLSRPSRSAHSHSVSARLHRHSRQSTHLRH
jgi:CBS-domain-containing membrane protein